MRAFPQGAWFGLTKRRLRLLGIVAVAMFAALCCLYAGARLLLTMEAQRAASLLAELKKIQLGQSADSVVPLVASYEDTPYEREVKVDRDTHVLRVDPWHFYRPFAVPNWLGAIVGKALMKSGNWRRKLGLRFWILNGGVSATGEKIQTVWAHLVVEGENEWLLADWDYVPKFPPSASSRYGDEEYERDHYRAHWTHVHMGDETGEGIVSSVTSLGTSEELEAARSINLKCLTDIGGCHSLCDLMPEATRYRRENNYGGWGWNSGSWGKQPHDCE